MKIYKDSALKISKVLKHYSMGKIIEYFDENGLSWKKLDEYGFYLIVGFKYRIKINKKDYLYIIL